MKATIQVDLPDGWRPVAYRPPKKGEWFANPEPYKATKSISSCRLVIEPTEGSHIGKRVKYRSGVGTLIAIGDGQFVVKTDGRKFVVVEEVELADRRG